MIYLILAIACSASISVLMRIAGKYSRSSMAMLAMNYVMCCLLGALYAGPSRLFPQVDGLGLTIGLGVIGGVLFLGSFVLMQWNISRNGVVLPATFMKLGVIVPTLMSILVFRETPRATQIIGIIAALGAILLIQGGGRQAAGSIAGLVFLMLGGGCADAMSKIFEETAPAALKDQFLLYIFLVALVLCVLLCVLRKQRPGLMDILFGLAIGIPNYFSSRFLLLSLADVPAMVAYPSFSVGTIIAVALAGVLAFREKLDRRKCMALGVILAALVLLNV